MRDIDPFTFFGAFNRGILEGQRIKIVTELKQRFNLQSAVPGDFTGIPTLNNQSSWFFAYQPNRQPDDIARLWQVFKLALGPDPLNNPEFLNAFDAALEVRQTNLNLTMGLFWIRPNTFLSLDRANRQYLKIAIPTTGLSSQFYKQTVQSTRAQSIPIPDISLAAWKAAQEDVIVVDPPFTSGVDYWLVGAYWSSRDPADQTQRFLTEGMWENNYADRYLDDVKAMKPGDKIAIKAATTQRDNLPFDAQGHTVSVNIIKAIGTVVKNRNDGRTVEVDWVAGFKEKRWYFYTTRTTIWHLRTDDRYKMVESSLKLRDFVWDGKTQDYAWFGKQWWQTDTDAVETPSDDPEVVATPYGLEDIIAAGVFLDQTELTDLLDRLGSKKALILQGAPGVGKTFLARKLAYALMGEVASERLEMVQFHQAGIFGLQNGVFHEFCTKANADPDSDYVFIIDEINRGNLSQIFGEILMLIEHDKRGPEFSVPLVYRHQPDEARFFVPANLYVIGLMNIADRSLAMVDYALRRRFAFYTLQSKYDSPLFSQWLLDRAMDPILVQLITARLTALNQTIRDDPLLGENYQLGHSFFCPKGDNFTGLDRDWYSGIVRTEVVPLLKEYWFDNASKAALAEKALLAP